MARKWLGDELVIAGRLSEARAEYERALRDDPMSPIIINAVAEARLHHDRDFDGALELFRRALELDPAFPPAPGGLAYLYCLQGNTDAALLMVKIPPAYEQLRSDPRFKEVLRCVPLD